MHENKLQNVSNEIVVASYHPVSRLENVNYIIEVLLAALVRLLVFGGIFFFL
jgi:hypothetical protein